MLIPGELLNGARRQRTHHSSQQLLGRLSLHRADRRRCLPELQDPLKACIEDMLR